MIASVLGAFFLNEMFTTTQLIGAIFIITGIIIVQLPDKVLCKLHSYQN